MPHTVSTAPDSSPTARRSVSLVDCDVHNQPTSIDDLMPHLSERWRIYMEESGFKSPPGPTYPKGFAPGDRRRDAPGDEGRQRDVLLWLHSELT